MLRGSSPIQLSQLDISPALQAGALEQQAAVNLNNTLQTSILEFAQKQEEKKVKREREAQINTFMPTFLQNMGINIKEGTPEYSSLIKYINNTSGGDIMSVLKTIGDIPMQTKTPSLQTISGPGGEQVYTFDGEVISPDKVIPAAPEKPTEPVDPIPTPINLENQGLYGRLIILDSEGNAPVGVEQGVVGLIDDTLSSTFGGSPIKLDPDIRAFKEDLEANLNKFATALTLNPDFSVREQEMVNRMKALSSGSFTSVDKLKGEMEGLNRRFDNEIERLNKLLETDLSNTARVNYTSMISIIQDAKNLLGVDDYNQSVASGLSIEDEEKELDDAF